LQRPFDDLRHTVSILGGQTKGHLVTLTSQRLAVNKPSKWSRKRATHPSLNAAEEGVRGGMA
jgi:hypothetical protein